MTCKNNILLAVPEPWVEYCLRGFLVAVVKSRLKIACVLVHPTACKV